MPVVLLSAVGSDAQGLKVLHETSENGVCTDYVLRADDCLTGTYCLVGQQGEMTLCLSDMRILDKLNSDYFKAKLEVLQRRLLLYVMPIFLVRQ